jgi:hypothetical protein
MKEWKSSWLAETLSKKKVECPLKTGGNRDYVVFLARADSK